MVKDRLEVLITRPEVRNLLMEFPGCRVRRCYVDRQGVLEWGIIVPGRQVEQILTSGRRMLRKNKSVDAPQRE